MQGLLRALCSRGDGASTEEEVGGEKEEEVAATKEALVFSVDLSCDRRAALEKLE
jgi:hypothetical protein